MSALLRWLVLLGWATLAPAADLQDCVATGANRVEQKTIRISDCPDLLRQLHSTSWPLTEPELTEEITPAQLRFLQRSGQARSGILSLNRGALAQLLQAVQQPDVPDERSPWWNAVNAWLDQLKHGDYEAQYRWLRSLLEAMIPSQAVARALIYGSLLLLVAASLGLVGVELYHAGWLPRFSGPGNRNAQPARGRSWTSSSVAATSALTPRQQLAAMLDAVTEALAARQLLPDDRALTHRQLLGAATERSGAILILQRLVEVTEPVLYGKREASEQLLAAVRSEASELLKPGRP